MEVSDLDGEGSLQAALLAPLPAQEEEEVSEGGIMYNIPTHHQHWKDFQKMGNEMIVSKEGR